MSHPHLRLVRRAASDSDSSTSHESSTRSSSSKTSSSHESSSTRDSSNSSKSASGSSSRSSSTASANVNAHVSASVTSSPSAAVPAATSSSVAAVNSDTASSTKSSSDGISSGALTGIIVAIVLVALAIIGFFVYRALRNRKNKKPRAVQSFGDAPQYGSDLDSFTYPNEKMVSTSSNESYTPSSPPPPVYAANSLSNNNHPAFHTPPSDSLPKPPPASVSSWGDHSSFGNNAPLQYNNNNNGTPRGDFAPAPSFALSPQSNSSSYHQQELQREPARSPLAATLGSPAALAATLGPAVSPFNDPVSSAPAPPAPIPTAPAPAAPAPSFTMYIVRRTFEPNYDDELAILPGDRIRVFNEYDDSWALAENLDHADPPPRGVLPMDCLGTPEPGELDPPFKLHGGVAPPPQHTIATPSPPKVDFSDNNIPKLNVTDMSTNSTPRPLSQERDPYGGLVSFDTPRPSEPPSEILNANNAQRQYQQQAHSPLEVKSQSSSTRRTSSLIASQDAELFFALGEVLGSERK